MMRPATGYPDEMPTVTRTFTVTAPPWVVVDYLKDFGHAEQWDPGTRSCQRIDTGPVIEGAFWHNVTKMLGVTAELTYKLEELTDRRVVFVGENQSARTVDAITVDRGGDGSVVTFQADIEMHGSAKLLGPLVKIAFEKRVGGSEKQLATVLNRLARTPG
ncbi:carbon monoxide dehydrogenase subunit G [Mycolicibacterium vaccae 95051]|nr:carbon monoxide dehydrogenase subunit G [Mycolicibacterium vaccae 95051]